MLKTKLKKLPLGLSSLHLSSNDVIGGSLVFENRQPSHFLN